MIQILVFFGADESIECDVRFHELLHGDITHHVLGGKVHGAAKIVRFDGESDRKVTDPVQLIGEQVDPLLRAGSQVYFLGAKELLEQEVFQVGVGCAAVDIPSNQGKDLKDYFNLAEWDVLPRGVEDVGGCEHGVKI